MAKEQLVKILDTYFNERMSPSRDLHATDNAVKSIDDLYQEPELTFDNSKCLQPDIPGAKQPPRACGVCKQQNNIISCPAISTKRE